MIIDVHTHLNNYDETRTVPITTTLAELDRSMQHNKVDHVMVLTSYLVNEHRYSVKEVVEATEAYPGMHVVAGVSFMNYKERDLREIADYLRAGKVVGLKIYPGYEPFYPYDKRCQVIYDLAAEFDVPVMIHTGVVKLARQEPEAGLLQEVLTINLKENQEQVKEEEILLRRSLARKKYKNKYVKP
jgi:predicted TIM-barrel fold metal-dependent hydrolase